MKTGKKGYQKHNKNWELKVSFKVDDELLDIDVNRDLHIPSADVITPAKVQNMMAENASIHARWNVLSNNAAFEYEDSKMEFEIWSKDQAKIYREEMGETTKKRVTDKMVEEAVMTDPEYIKKYRNVLKKKRDAANVKSIAIGFGEKGERLVNISSLMKSEKPTGKLSSRGDDDIRAFSDR